MEHCSHAPAFSARAVLTELSISTTPACGARLAAPRRVRRLRERAPAARCRPSRGRASARRPGCWCRCPRGGRPAGLPPEGGDSEQPQSPPRRAVWGATACDDGPEGAAGLSRRLQPTDRGHPPGEVPKGRQGLAVGFSLRIASTLRQVPKGRQDHGAGGSLPLVSAVPSGLSLLAAPIPAAEAAGQVLSALRASHTLHDPAAPFGVLAFRRESGCREPACAAPRQPR